MYMAMGQKQETTSLRGAWEGGSWGVRGTTGTKIEGGAEADGKAFVGICWGIGLPSVSLAVPTHTHIITCPACFLVARRTSPADRARTA